MAGADFQEVLKDLRAELDALDEQLVVLLKQRADVIARVVERKSASGLAPVDLRREEEMLAHIGLEAEKVGLDPGIARQILRAVIEAFTAVEAHQLGTTPG